MPVKVEEDAPAAVHGKTSRLRHPEETTRANSAEESPTTEARALTGAAHTWRALRHRNFRLFFGGQSISLIGTWMTRIATSWLVYRLTGSALLL